MPTFTIDAGDLITALKASLPHAHEDPEVPTLHRVRLSIGGVLQVSAGSPYSIGICRADKLIDPDGEVWGFDLWPSDTAAVAKMFKPGKDETITVRVDLGADKRVTFTDASGFIDGRAYTVPTMDGADKTADFGKLIAAHLLRPVVDRGVTEFTGRYWRGFIESASALGAALTIEPTGENQPFVVRIGGDFVGLLMPHRFDQQRAAELDRIRKDWLAFLPDPDPDAQDQP